MNKFIKNICAPVFILLLVSALCNNIQTMAADIEKTGIPAFPVRYTVSVNGQNYILQAFSVDGQDYFKMRDIAFILKDTIMRFDISWHAVLKGFVSFRKNHAPAWPACFHTSASQYV